MHARLTIIVPIFDEEASLPAFYQEMDHFLAQSSVPALVLLVDDGSRDSSLRLIKEKCSADSRYQFIALARNCGLSTAIKAGIDQCQTELVGYIDADLQTHPADFLGYFEFFPEFDMVNGIRARRQDSLIKRLSSKTANWYRRLMIDDGIADTCCPLKIMKSDFAKAMPFFKGMHRFMPALVQLQGGRVKQLAVGHSPRLAGQSKYHLLNRLVGPFFDTLAFRWMRSRNIRYRIADRTQ